MHDEWCLFAQLRKFYEMAQKLTAGHCPPATWRAAWIALEWTPDARLVLAELELLKKIHGALSTMIQHRLQYSPFNQTMSSFLRNSTRWAAPAPDTDVINNMAALLQTVENHDCVIQTSASLIESLPSSPSLPTPVWTFAVEHDTVPPKGTMSVLLDALVNQCPFVAAAFHQVVVHAGEEGGDRRATQLSICAVGDNFPNDEDSVLRWFDAHFDHSRWRNLDALSTRDDDNARVEDDDMILVHRTCTWLSTFDGPCLPLPLPSPSFGAATVPHLGWDAMDLEARNASTLDAFFEHVGPGTQHTMDEWATTIVDWCGRNGRVAPDVARIRERLLQLPERLCSPTTTHPKKRKLSLSTPPVSQTITRRQVHLQETPAH